MIGAIGPGRPGGKGFHDRVMWATSATAGNRPGRRMPNPSTNPAVKTYSLGSSHCLGHGAVRLDHRQHCRSSHDGQPAANAHGSQGRGQQLHPESGGVYSDQRLDGRPVWHPARVRHRGDGVYAGVGVVRSGAERSDVCRVAHAARRRHHREHLAAVVAELRSCLRVAGGRPVSGQAAANRTVGGYQRLAACLPDPRSHHDFVLDFLLDAAAGRRCQRQPQRPGAGSKGKRRGMGPTGKDGSMQNLATTTSAQAENICNTSDL